MHRNLVQQNDKSGKKIHKEERNRRAGALADGLPYDAFIAHFLVRKQESEIVFIIRYDTFLYR